MRLSVFALALCCVVASVANAQTCTWSSGGENWNFNGMKLTGTQNWQTTGGDYTYYLNVCAPINGHSDCVAGEQSRPCAAAQYLTSSGVKEAGMAVYDDQDPKWEILPGPAGNGIQWTFTNGDKTCYDAGEFKYRTVRVKFTCETTKAPYGTLACDGGNCEPSVCTYVFTIKGHGCPGTDPGPGPDPGPDPDKGGSDNKGLSGGWVFVIILLVTTFVYIVGGCVFKSQKQGTRGMESCPNVDFWRSIPGLVKDGFVFTFHLIKSGCKSGKPGSYEAV